MNIELIVLDKNNLAIDPLVLDIEGVNILTDTELKSTLRLHIITD